MEKRHGAEIRFAPFLLRAKLLSLGCTNRASAFASAALNANVCVDDVLAVTLGDGTNGASISASAASHALIRNLVSHDRILHSIVILLL